MRILFGLYLLVIVLAAFISTISAQDDYAKLTHYPLYGLLKIEAVTSDYYSTIQFVLPDAFGPIYSKDISIVYRFDIQYPQGDEPFYYHTVRPVISNNNTNNEKTLSFSIDSTKMGFASNLIEYKVNAIVIIYRDQNIEFSNQMVVKSLSIISGQGTSAVTRLLAERVDMTSVRRESARSVNISFLDQPLSRRLFINSIDIIQLPKPIYEMKLTTDHILKSNWWPYISSPSFMLLIADDYDTCILSSLIDNNNNGSYIVDDTKDSIKLTVKRDSNYALVFTLQDSNDDIIPSGSYRITCPFDYDGDDDEMAQHSGIGLSYANSTPNSSNIVDQFSLIGNMIFYHKQADDEEVQLLMSYWSHPDNRYSDDDDNDDDDNEEPIDDTDDNSDSSSVSLYHHYATILMFIYIVSVVLF